MLKVLASWNKAGSFITIFDPAYYAGKRLYRLKSKKGFVFFGLRPQPSNSVLIHSLRAQFPGKGDGSDIMRKLCNYADLLKVTLVLTPNPGYGSLMTKAQLADWYRKFGFSGTSKLQRKPQIKVSL